MIENFFNAGKAYHRLPGSGRFDTLVVATSKVPLEEIKDEGIDWCNLETALDGSQIRVIQQTQGGGRYNTSSGAVDFTTERIIVRVDVYQL